MKNAFVKCYMKTADRRKDPILFIQELEAKVVREVKIDAVSDDATLFRIRLWNSKNQRIGPDKHWILYTSSPRNEPFNDDNDEPKPPSLSTTIKNINDKIYSNTIYEGTSRRPTMYLSDQESVCYQLEMTSFMAVAHDYHREPEDKGNE